MPGTLIQRESVIIKVFSDDGLFPNNGTYPIVIYRDAVKLVKGNEAKTFEDLFESNGWSNSWRNGIYNFHHYHSVTHEVLGVYAGSAKVQLGGPGGKEYEINKGDVIIIPAGVAHKNLGSSGDFACIGAYPEGKDYDMNYGKKEERENALENISSVKLPHADPVYGEAGKLFDFWK